MFEFFISIVQLVSQTFVIAAMLNACLTQKLSKKFGAIVWALEFSG